MNATARWMLLAALAAGTAVLLSPTQKSFARGGGGSGGRKGGKSKGGMGNVEGRTDYLDEMLQEDFDEGAAGFRDDATREPLRRIRAAARGG